jgi:hypothetical protein
MGTTKCFRCEKEFDDSFNFCPHCGREKGASLEEMKFEDMEEIRKALVENTEKYKDKMKKSGEILDLIDEKDKKIFEFQKEFIDRFLGRFPRIKDSIREEDFKFYLFIMGIPYYKENKEYQHDCILQKLAERQSGIVNLSLNVEEISSQLFSVDIPIWTDAFSEKSIEEQYMVLKKEIPDGQMYFIESAEPWYYLDRVYKFDGKWINWKFVFRIPPDKFEEFVNKNKEVPINVQNLSPLKYYNYISTAGTASDGETIVGIIERDEKELFYQKYEEINRFYYEGSPPELEMIEISWDILKDMGFLYRSIDKILRSKKHIFSKSLADIVTSISQEELAKFTQNVTFRKNLDEETLNKILVNSSIDRVYKRYESSTIGIYEPIQRKSRDQYRISGGKK